MLLRNDSSSHSPPFLWAQESAGLDEGDLRQAPTLQPVPVAVPLAHAGYSSLRGAGLSPHIITRLAVVVLPACWPPDNCAPSRAIRPEGQVQKAPRPSGVWQGASAHVKAAGSSGTAVSGLPLGEEQTWVHLVMSWTPVATSEILLVAGHPRDRAWDCCWKEPNPRAKQGPSDRRERRRRISSPLGD